MYAEVSIQDYPYQELGFRTSGKHMSSACVYVIQILIVYLSRHMKFPTIWYVQQAKAQISMQIRAV